MWNDAAALQESNGAVLSSWANFGSGGAVTCTGVVCDGCKNNLKTVRLSYSQTWGIASLATITSFTLFWAGRQTGPNNQRGLQGAEGNANQIYGYHGHRKKVFFSENNPSLLTGVAADYAWDQFTFQRQAGGAFFMNANGTPNYYANSSSEASGMRGLTINGETGCCTTQSTDMEIAEIILYDRLLSNTEVLQIEDYLRSKWALQADCSLAPSQVGYVIAGGSSLNGASRTTSCATGYVGTGSSITCASPLAPSWSLATGCSIQSCGAPVLSAGYALGANTGENSAGASYALVCASGYRGIPNSITCQSNGSWTAQTGCVENSLPLSCSAYKYLGYPSGYYGIQIFGFPATTVYCDMTPFGRLTAYTFQFVSNGLSGYTISAANSCTPNGMNIWIPRTKAHIARAYNFANFYVGQSSIIDTLQPFGVYRPAGGCGTCCARAFNYDSIEVCGASDLNRFRALDNRFWSVLRVHLLDEIVLFHILVCCYFVSKFRHYLCPLLVLVPYIYCIDFFYFCAFVFVFFAYRSS